MPDNVTPAAGDAANGQPSEPVKTPQTTGTAADTSAAGGPAPNAPAATPPAEDRSKWIPPHRLTEETGKRTAAETARQAAEARAELLQRQLQALTGATPPTPEAQEEDAVRQAILKLFPQLGKLDDATIERVLQTAQNADGINAAQQHVFKQHADQMLGQLETEVARAYGIEELTPSQRKSLTRQYRLEAEACVEARKDPSHDASNDFLARHMRGDKTLIAEFAQQFANDWLEPAKRTVTSQQFGRLNTRVPSGRGGTPRTTQAPKVNYADDDAFGDALVAAAKAQG